jgi:two-component sensor histidine kinase
MVRDDGVGFPLGVDFGKTETLGLEIVRPLTEQLNGSIAIERDKGTTFRIRFEEPKYKPRILPDPGICWLSVTPHHCA